MAKVGFISLGCEKNRVDLEQMLNLLEQGGFEICFDELEGTDAVIINTCGFIESAKAEAIEKILQTAALKDAGLVGRIIVTGCLAQRYQDDIINELPEVDAVVGCGSYPQIVRVVNRVLDGKTCRLFGDLNARRPEIDRVTTRSKHTAFIKIAEGCNNRCAYCVIPSLRGDYQSRKIEDVLCEVRARLAEGAKELILIAQDTTRYGTDIYPKPMLPTLVEQICSIEGDFWVRLHYLYPTGINQELIDVIKTQPKVVRYLDIPIQHINTKVLKKMNRRGDSAYIENLFNNLRRQIDGICIRTTVIVGLPHEGQEEFDQLCEFLARQQLERVGVFAYSPEEGTPASRMRGRVSQEEKERRAELVNDLQSRIIDKQHRAMAGKTCKVLCEGEEDGIYHGRTEKDSPEIDCFVRFTSKKPVMVGQFVQVLIDRIDDSIPFGKTV